MPPLKAIGFWSAPSLAITRPELGPHDPYVEFLANARQAQIEAGIPFLPDPNRLLELLGSCSYGGKILSYVASGHVIASYMGYSVCRCCGLANTDLGDSDLTDGTWVWPEGLSHYLRVHRLPLPRAFVETMEQNGYSVPALTRQYAAGDRNYDFTFWHGWTATIYQGQRDH